MPLAAHHFLKCSYAVPMREFIVSSTGPKYPDWSKTFLG